MPYVSTYLSLPGVESSKAVKQEAVKPLWPCKTSFSLQGPGWRIHWALDYLSIGRHARFHKQFLHNLLPTLVKAQSRLKCFPPFLSLSPFSLSPGIPNAHRKCRYGKLMRVHVPIPTALATHRFTIRGQKKRKKERKKESRHKCRKKEMGREEEKRKRVPSVSEWYWREVDT